MSLLVSALFVLGGSILVDVFYVFWIATVSAKTPLAAAFCAAAITLLGGTYIVIVDTHWLLVVACAGHALGSFVATHMGLIMQRRHEALVAQMQPQEEPANSAEPQSDVSGTINAH